MNADVKKIAWIVVGGIVLVTAVSGLIQSHRTDDARQALAETRQALREQGFKTDLAEFNVTTDDETLARVAALTVFNSPLELDADDDRLDLLPRVADDTAAVIWRQDSLSAGQGTLQWSDIHKILGTNQAALDAACTAALSGPIRFEVDWSRWNEHGSQMRYLSLALSSRTILELREGNQNAAWTNLLSATRIVTQWETEPAEISQLIRLVMSDDAFADTWQGLQYETWADEKLVALQQEWEAVNFFTNLAETVALDRAVVVDICQWLSRQPPFTGIAREVVRDPAKACSDIRDGVEILRYRGDEALTDEKNLLCYFRDRELTFRRAVQASTWAEMRALPGVTNAVQFKSAYKDLLQYTRSYLESEKLILAWAAQAEAQRRILITAIALERYRGKHGAYPPTLALLSPEFLKDVPLDFMDGNALRYHLTQEGHFILYSVGLDCVDDGGKMPLPDAPRMPKDSQGFYIMPTNVDIVWPRPDIVPTKASHP